MHAAMHACMACGFCCSRNGQHVLPAQNELRSTDDVVRLLYSNAVPFRADAVLLVGAWVSQHVAQQADQVQIATHCVPYQTQPVFRRCWGVPHLQAATHAQQQQHAGLLPSCSAQPRQLRSSDDQCMQATLLSMYSDDIHG